MAFTAFLALAEQCARQGQLSAGTLGGDASRFTAAAYKVQNFMWSWQLAFQSKR